nr:MAG: hypothetical protein DIU78_17045 [Pseudomonadota bacterium]
MRARRPCAEKAPSRDAISEGVRPELSSRIAICSARHFEFACRDALHADAATLRAGEVTDVCVRWAGERSIFPFELQMAGA